MVGLGWYLDVMGSDSHVLVWVFEDFGAKSQKEEKGKPGKIGPFVTAKVASPWRSRGPKRPPHKFAAVWLCYAATKALFTKAKNFGFCFESLIFVH